MTRVVFLKSRLAHRGGLEHYTHKLASAFAAKGCDVTILTTGPVPPIEGIEVISVAPGSKFSLFHLWRFDRLCQKWLANNQAKIIFGMERNSYQTHYRAGSGVHAVYLKQRRASFLKRLSFALNPLHRYILKLEKQAFEHPDLRVLFTNSHMVKQEILNTYATPEEKIKVVHNGVAWSDKAEAFEKSLERSPAPYHFLFVGNDFTRKGLPELLAALKTLKSPYQLTVVGKGTPIKAPHTRYVGPQSNVTPFYAAADALVLPSLYDPFSNVTLEALAMGLFVLTSKTNGAHEILEPTTGIVIDDLPTDLNTALNHPKTPDHARSIRQSVKALDFSSQLDKIVTQTL